MRSAMSDVPEPDIAREDPRSRRVVRGHVAAMVVSTVPTALPWGRFPVEPLVAHASSGAFAGVGAALMLWTLAHLGRATRAQIAPLSLLVTTGPFSLVRHPYYTGITLILYGYALWRASVFGCIGVSLLLVPIQLHRI